MKTKGFILLVSVVLFSSCIVKSLRPFYLDAKIVFDDRLIGKWQSGKTGKWEIESFKKKWEEDYKKDKNKEQSKEDKATFEMYKDAYIVKYTKSEKEALFIATPFMVGKHLFINFTPFEYDSEKLNSLAVQHLLKAHSAAFVDFQNDDILKLKWVDESIVQNLIKNNKIRIDYEKTGIDDDFILTASSQELFAFLEKFMAANLDKKWDDGSTFTLRPYETQP